MLYDISYNMTMHTILRSATFDRWLGRLRDRQAVNRIVARLLAAEDGHLGDVRPVGGGDKDSQRRDIERAKRMATEWRS